jgi:integrase
MPEPARTAVATAAFTGIRRGELAGLLWENFDPKKCSLNITQSFWEGHVTKPKTRKSSAPVPVIKILAQMLESHRIRSAQARARSAQNDAAKAQKQLAGDLAPEKRNSLEQIISAAKELANNPPIPRSGPIFASAKGTPLNMNNLLNRQILPALDRCVCGQTRGDHAGETHAFEANASNPKWHGWHGFRRGLGTNLKRVGVDLKTIQDILRHAHITTTADIYVKEVSEDTIAAMQLLEQRVELELRGSMQQEVVSAYSAASLQ